jgi:hypothetical protein
VPVIDGSNYDGYFDLSSDNGTDWWSIDAFSFSQSNWWSFGDFGGNGCTGMLMQSASSNELEIPCISPSAQSTVSFSQFSAPSYLVWIQVLGDFNGDGTTDVLVFLGSSAELYLSTGRGLVDSGTITNLPSLGTYGTDYSIVAGDWNRDGKTDIAFVSQKNANNLFYLSTGTGFVELGSGISTGDGTAAPTVADLNNDGAEDIWVQSLTSTVASHEILFGNTPELMIGIDNGMGATTSVSYNRLNDGTMYTKGTGAT